jgi:hypothetical protein
MKDQASCMNADKDESASSLTPSILLLFNRQDYFE